MTWSCTGCSQEDGSVWYEGGFCGECRARQEIQELKKINEDLHASLQRAIAHGTDEESQKWTALAKVDALGWAVTSVISHFNDNKRYQGDLVIRDVVRVLKEAFRDK